MSGHNLVDWIGIIFCVYLFYSTYREKAELSYKIIWYVPFVILFSGGVSDLLGFDFGETVNLVFRSIFYVTLGWALFYTFIIRKYVRKKS